MHQNTWKALRHLYPTARAGSPSRPGDYELHADAEGNTSIATWSLPGDPPTEEEIDAAIAAYDAAETQRAQEAATLRQQVVTVAGSAVGVVLTDLTAPQVKALLAVLLHKAGALDKDGKVRVLSEWVKD